MKIRPVGPILFRADGQRDQSLFAILRTLLINDRWLDVKPHSVVLKQYQTALCHLHPVAGYACELFLVWSEVLGAYGFTISDVPEAFWKKLQSSDQIDNAIRAQTVMRTRPLLHTWHRRRDQRVILVPGGAGGELTRLDCLLLHWSVSGIPVNTTEIQWLCYFLEEFCTI